MSDDDFRERFLKANARPEVMGPVLADFVRRMMRASINNDGSQRYEAIQALHHFFDLVAHADDVSTFDIVESAIGDLAVDVEYEDWDYDKVRLAEDAVRYYLEMSCNDGLANARASKRWMEFMSGMKNYEEDRAYRAERWNKRNK